MDKNDDFEDQLDDNNDEFGLPSPDYEPLNQEAEPDQVQYRESEPEPSDLPEDDEKHSNSTVVVIVIILAALLLGGGAGAGYFFYFKPKWEQEEQKAKLAKLERIKRDKKKARIAKLKQEEEARKKAAEDSVANAKNNVSTSPKQRGSIETLSSRTGRYHVIVSSVLDDDLLMDYAKRLARKGISTKVIPPYGKVRFYRLALDGDYDTFARAQQQANDVGSNYQQSLWVLKY